MISDHPPLPGSGRRSGFLPDADMRRVVQGQYIRPGGKRQGSSPDTLPVLYRIPLTVFTLGCYHGVRTQERRWEAMVERTAVDVDELIFGLDETPILSQR